MTTRMGRPKGSTRGSVDERNADICRRVASGEKQTDLAAEYGITKQMISLIARENGESIFKTRRRRLIDDVHRRFLAGESVGIIAHEYGRSPNTIEGYLYLRDENGDTVRQRRLRMMRENS